MGGNLKGQNATAAKQGDAGCEASRRFVVTTKVPRSPARQRGRTPDGQGNPSEAMGYAEWQTPTPQFKGILLTTPTPNERDKKTAPQGAFLKIAARLRASLFGGPRQKVRKMARAAGRRVSQSPTPLAFARSPMPIGGRRDPPQQVTTVPQDWGTSQGTSFFTSSAAKRKTTSGSKGGRARNRRVKTQGRARRPWLTSGG